MLQYLLNTTVIWLLCLVGFEVFLRKETYHGYNRFYLLATLLAGAIIPLFQWYSNDFAYAQGLQQSVTKVVAVKQTITNNAAATYILSWWAILAIIYSAGVLVSLFWVVRELLMIQRYYRQGNLSKDGVWTVVETGNAHAPFSAFRAVYISSKENYTAEELAVILIHEEQHGHKLHMLDMLVLQLAKVVFWFHPLIYVYYKRMLMVHEYEADAAVDRSPKEYGTFLLEQSMLKQAPSVAHSFNHSPLKNRIMMLTRKSSRRAGSKKLIVLPMLAISMLCFTKNAFSDSKKTRNGNAVTYRGNVIKFMTVSVVADTIMVEDPVTGEMSMMTSIKEASPMLLNDQQIYDEREIAIQPTTGKNASNRSSFTSGVIREYLLNNMKSEIKSLPDGKYVIGIEHIVIDKEGKIAYFDLEGITIQNNDQGNNSKAKKAQLSSTVKKAIDQKIVDLLNDAPAHSAAVVNGIEVPTNINATEFWNPFEVKDGKLVSL